MSALSRRARPLASADCVTCGQVCPDRTGKPAAARRWASRHAEQNPGHRAHVITEQTRVYGEPVQPYRPAAADGGA